MGAAIGRTKSATILVLGLDNSGKTTVVNCLKNPTVQEPANVVPSVGVTVQKIRRNSIEMNMCDVAGKLRAAWEKFYKKCDGIIFVLDSSDPLRLAVVKEELAQTLSHEDLDQKPIPMLFLANKMDLSNAVDCACCRSALGLDDIRNRRWRVYSSNALTGEGLTEAMGWFTDEVQNFIQRTTLTT